MANLGHNEAATHIACTLLAENIAGQPIACMQYGTQPRSDYGLHGVYSNIGHLFTFIKIIRCCCLHALTRNLGKKVSKKRNFIISARDGRKPVIKQENSAKSGNVGISDISQ